MVLGGGSRMKSFSLMFLVYLGATAMLAAAWIWANGTQAGDSVFRYVGF